MKNLLYKEFKLALHPTVFFFLLFGMLLMIPSWPYFIAFGYIFIAVMNTLFICRANQDTFFTVSLPVRKRDVVRARVIAFAVMELLQVLTAIPFAFLHNAVFGTYNAAGMNLNMAFFGCVLIMYGLFNLVLFPMFYKNAYKAGIPVLLAVVTATVFILLVELAVHVPLAESNINAMIDQQPIYQLPFLFGGIVLFALLTLASSRMAEKNFEKVDL